MAFLGLATGLRPSSLRPLRRKGDQVDVQLDAGRLLVRRSQTIGETVLNVTKQKTRYVIELPARVIDVLRWHIETQLEMPEQRDSDLLFPAVTGGFRAPTVLMSRSPRSPRRSTWATRSSRAACAARS